MTHILRFLQVFTLGTWLGGILYLSFAVAPAAFGTLGSRDQAGALVGLILARLHIFGMIFGVIYLLAAVALEKSLGGFVRPAALCVILMLALTAYSNWRVTPRMASLRAEMVSVDRTPHESPLRIEFDRLHRISVHIEGGVLLLGIAALFLAVRHHR